MNVMKMKFSSQWISYKRNLFGTYNFMDRDKYKELLSYLEGNILEKWNNTKLRELLNGSKNFEAKNGILYRKGINGKVLRVLKGDEIDSIIFMTHNHPTGGHFGKDATY